MTYIKHTTIYTTILVLILVIANPAFSEEEDNNDAKPMDGELLLPDDYNAGEEKKCLTVCQEWGENCIINPGTGSRKCRRVCKSFAEECF